MDARVATLKITDELTADVNFGVFSENVHAYSGVVVDALAAGDNNVALYGRLTTKDPNAVVVVKNGTNVVTAANNAYALTSGRRKRNNNHIDSRLSRAGSICGCP